MHNLRCCPGICLDRPQNSLCLAEIGTVYLGNTFYSRYGLSQRARYMELLKGNCICFTMDIMHSRSYKLKLTVRNDYNLTF